MPAGTPRRRLVSPPASSQAPTGVGVSPLVRVESEASREFRAWCSEFGLTPAAEAKLSADVAAADSGDLF
jgi:phage terminase small subunit